MNDEMLAARVRRTQLLKGLREIQAARLYGEAINGPVGDGLFVGLLGLLAAAAVSILLTIALAALLAHKHYWNLSTWENLTGTGFMLFIVLLPATISVGTRLAARGREARQRDAQRNLERAINRFADEHATSVASWGGAKVLYDKEVVRTLMHSLANEVTEVHSGSVATTRREKNADGGTDALVNIIIAAVIGAALWYFWLREPPPEPRVPVPPSYSNPFGQPFQSSPSPGYGPPAFQPEPAFGDRYQQQRLKERIEELERQGRELQRQERNRKYGYGYWTPCPKSQKISGPACNLYLPSLGGLRPRLSSSPA
jgi:hypothetical protein